MAIIAVLGFVGQGGWALVAISRENTQALETRITAMQGDIRELKADIGWLRDRERQGR